MSKLACTASPRADHAYSSVLTVDFLSPPWPARIVYLHDYYNTASIKLPYVVHYGDCDCSDPCQIDTCRNAQMNVFCTDSYCVWEELCANRPVYVMADTIPPGQAQQYHDDADSVIDLTQEEDDV
ncbi:hypothetical protein GQ600_25590 [Phytophthora cactorum]|nr:hypothetical protein GQ600_25590 [Phytophthora cactorum]